MSCFSAFTEDGFRAQIVIGGQVLSYDNIAEKDLWFVLQLLREYGRSDVEQHEGEGHWALLERVKHQVQMAPHERIVALRKQLGMTQQQLATRLEMAAPNLSKIESGKRGISKVVARELGDVFDVNYRLFL